jgi:hypothetical protein
MMRPHPSPAAAPGPSGRFYPLPRRVPSWERAAQPPAD